MTREELEHIIRASGDITDQYEFVIIGSQSMLGAVSSPEEVFLVSMEADIYPLLAPDPMRGKPRPSGRGRIARRCGWLDAACNG